jgi:5S rRNA maturation endonuclease (ribonuclease M5)
VQKTDLSKVDIRLAVVDEPPLNPAEPVYIKCPEHQEKTASCAVFSDHIHCFPCGFHIPYRMESLAFLLGIPLKQAFKYARRYTSEGLDAYRERAAVEARRDPLPPSLAEGYQSILWNSRSTRLRWFEDRGIPLEWVDWACLGHDGEKFCIPIWDKDKNLLNIRFRRDDEYYIAPEDGERPTPKYSGMRGRNGTYFYPEWLFHAAYIEGPYVPSIVGWRGDWVAVCEGELDALRLWVEGIPAISPTNGASSVKQVAGFLKQFSRIKYILIMTDQDAAGDRATEEFTRAMWDGQWAYMERVTWPQEFKDITEYLQKAPDVARDVLAQYEERMSAC